LNDLIFIALIVILFVILFVLMADSQEQGGRSSIPSTNNFQHALSPKAVAVNPIEAFSFGPSRIYNTKTNTSSYFNL